MSNVTEISRTPVQSRNTATWYLVEYEDENGNRTTHHQFHDRMYGEDKQYSMGYTSDQILRRWNRYAT